MFRPNQPPFQPVIPIPSYISNQINDQPPSIIYDDSPINFEPETDFNEQKLAYLSNIVRENKDTTAKTALNL